KRCAQIMGYFIDKVIELSVSDLQLFLYPLTFRDIYVDTVNTDGLVFQCNRHSIHDNVDKFSIAMPAFCFDAHHSVIGDEIIQVDAFMSEFLWYDKVVDAATLEFAQCKAKHFFKAFINLLDSSGFIKKNNSHWDVLEKL